MVNESLAHASDLGVQAALAGYVMALVCFGIEFAARRGGVPTATEAASVALRAAERSGSVGGGVAVLDRDGTGGPANASYPVGTIGRVTATERVKPPTSMLFGRSGVVVLIIGFAAHVLSIVTRGVAADRWPWGNMYEFTSLMCAVAVAGFLVVLVRTGARTIGFFALIPVVILLYVAVTVLYKSADGLVPALHSYWLLIHVLAVSSSSGVLMVAGAASVLYLCRARYERKLAAETAWAAENLPADSYLPAGVVAPESAGDGAPAARALVTTDSRWARLPSLATLDRIAYRTTIVAFPVYTFAVIAGAMWAEVAWGRYWGWDPKETCAFVTWVFYAAYLHARSTAGWRGVKSAWISVLGFASMLFNLFAINLVVSGLHSYAGLN